MSVHQLTQFIQNRYFKAVLPHMKFLSINHQNCDLIRNYVLLNIGHAKFIILSRDRTSMQILHYFIFIQAVSE